MLNTLDGEVNFVPLHVFPMVTETVGTLPTKITCKAAFDKCFCEEGQNIPGTKEGMVEIDIQLSKAISSKQRARYIRGTNKLSDCIPFGGSSRATKILQCSTSCSNVEEGWPRYRPRWKTALRASHLQHPMLGGDDRNKRGLEGIAGVRIRRNRKTAKSSHEKSIFKVDSVERNRRPES